MRVITATMLVVVLSAGCGRSGDGEESSAEGGEVSGTDSYSRFQVNAITPADQALVSDFASEIEVVFNEATSAASISPISPLPF